MDKEKKRESLRFLLAAASKIYGERKLMEMLIEQGAPSRDNLDELANGEGLRFTHLTTALKESADFVGQLEIRLSELCVMRRRTRWRTLSPASILKTTQLG